MKVFHVLVIKILLLGNALGSLNIISSAGSLVPASKIDGLLSSIPGQCKVVSAVGGRGTGKSSLLNEIFGTKLSVRAPLSPPALSKACLEISDDVVILDCEGNGNEDDSIQAKAAYLACAVSDLIFWNIWSSDVGRNVAVNSQTLKQLFSQKAQYLQTTGSAAKKTVLVVAVHDCPDDFDEAVAKAAVMEDLSSLWADLVKEDDTADFQAYFDLRVAPLASPSAAAARYRSGCAALKAQLGGLLGGSAQYSKGLTGARFAAELERRWADARALPPLATRAEQAAAFLCDAAFDRAAAGAEEEVRAWKAAVAGGRAVPRFGDRVGRALDGALGAFAAETRAAAGAAAREARRRELRALVLEPARALLRQQLQLEMQTALRGLRAALAQHLGKRGELGLEARQALVRAAAFDFECAAAPLANEGLGLTYAQEKEALDKALEDLAENYAESPAAKLVAMKKLEKEAKKKKVGGKKQRSFDLACDIVSMVSFPGKNRIQGYVNRSLGKHTVTVGFEDTLNPSYHDPVDGRWHWPVGIRLQPQLRIEADI